jgi:hypothetical protein
MVTPNTLITPITTATTSVGKLSCIVDVCVKIKLIKTAHLLFYCVL